MILFVFEGEEREPDLYKTLERLYFPKGNGNIICSFRNNIYALYKEMEALEGEGDIVAVMKERLAERGDTVLDGLRSSDYSEIYLFFDYDYQHAHLTLDEINGRVEEMLRLFDEETENGKLYINYPMIESIMYTKELPDENYVDYVVTREECREFKRIAHDFSFYSNLDHLLFKGGETPNKDRFMKIADNWQYLKQMNVRKANLIVSGRDEIPAKKSDINQRVIFEGQRRKYVDVNESVAILNSFPLFVYEYLR